MIRLVKFVSATRDPIETITVDLWLAGRVTFFKPFWDWQRLDDGRKAAFWVDMRLDELFHAWRARSLLERKAELGAGEGSSNGK